MRIKPYLIFEKSLYKKDEGFGLVLSFKYSGQSGDRFISFYMSSGPTFIECSKGLIYSMVKDLDYQLKEGAIKSTSDILKIFKKDGEFKKALRLKIKNIDKIDIDSVKIHELTPRAHKSNSINRFKIKEKIKSSKEYDPNNMRDSDDEDSIPYPGWESDNIISHLYKMFKGERDLFKKIASGL